MYFFVLSSAALVAGFASTLTDGKYGTAFVIAVAAAFISVVFNLLERRAKELVKAGERAFREFENRLTDKVGITQLALVDQVEATKVSRAASYSKAINLLHGIAIVGWCAAAIYVWYVMYPPSVGLGGRGNAVSPRIVTSFLSRTSLTLAGLVLDILGVVGVGLTPVWASKTGRVDAWFNDPVPVLRGKPRIVLLVSWLLILLGSVFQFTAQLKAEVPDKAVH